MNEVFGKKTSFIAYLLLVYDKCRLGTPRGVYISGGENPFRQLTDSGGSKRKSSVGGYKSRGLCLSSLVASGQTVMRKREHAGFVTRLRPMSLPKRVKSVIAYYESIGTQGICQIVRICGVAGVESDGMFAKGI